MLMPNHHTYKQLKIWLDEQQTIKYEPAPKYLGINLNRSLTFKHHIEQLKSKVSARVSLVKQLAGTKWGASYRALRISALALLYASAEYCAPVWCRSSHSHKVDVVLNEAMRTITGCLKSTPLSYLPFLAGIIHPKLRRDTSCLSLYTKAKHVDHLLHHTLCIQPTPTRLKSRWLLWPYVEHLEIEYIALPQVPSPLKLYINELTPKPNGYQYPRKSWVQLNRLRTGVGRFKANMVKMGLAASNQCECGSVQTAEHILQECPMLRPPFSISVISREDLLQYLLNIEFWRLLALYCVYGRREECLSRWNRFCSQGNLRNFFQYEFIQLITTVVINHFLLADLFLHRKLFSRGPQRHNV